MLPGMVGDPGFDIAVPVEGASSTRCTQKTHTVDDTRLSRHIYVSSCICAVPICCCAFTACLRISCGPFEIWLSSKNRHAGAADPLGGRNGDFEDNPRGRVDDGE